MANAIILSISNLGSSDLTPLPSLTSTQTKASMTDRLQKQGPILKVRRLFLCYTTRPEASRTETQTPALRTCYALGFLHDNELDLWGIHWVIASCRTFVYNISTRYSPADAGIKDDITMVVEPGIVWRKERSNDRPFFFFFDSTL